ncbi:hypothetical protein AB1I92_25695 [Bacillus mobilis]|uniref:Uncharacterized protein n=2 Tax=Bacillus cereus group TaxID=86661 RepID=A0A1C3ZEY0_BACCE|nr:MULTISPECIES: hypothetical protein [Bacillus cereus group]MCC2463477.1 hypothetical protein [Bacillus mobilis]MCU5433267.1 hypothetical protein [Bacillus mobilis]MCU5593839.1 hypothetical protein [Bacillus mobilis]MCU5736153.1 hypothetical protein [Bacillus mobilis]MCU9558488.1 hypothetical protein [Bacillus mobilis]
MLEKGLNRVNKVEVMDKHLDSHQGKITSTEVCNIVMSIFKFDLTTKPVLSKEWIMAEAISSTENIAKIAIDSGLAHYGERVAGIEIRQLINQIFGINLDAISSLEGARISLFSKEQWVVRDEQDLFVVHTGLGDVDVKIFTTDYFTEQTGLGALPKSLQQSLTNFGFSCDEKAGCYYYSNPSGEAIPDAFKGQIIGTILKEIHDSYQSL